ncbi:hypothetical protein ACFWSF_23080 [Streptomyces sp. NPDC058611]|uniref:hypothetical protein n=1 Tax=unclassified Streptomyces TaxID=2593676 RepID=UPI003660C063
MKLRSTRPAWLLVNFPNTDVDSGLLEPDQLANHHRPVRPRHQLGEDVVAEDAAQLVGRPARRHLLRVLAELLLLARESLLGGAADRVGDGHHQPVGHRGGLRSLPARARNLAPA